MIHTEYRDSIKICIQEITFTSKRWPRCKNLHVGESGNVLKEETWIGNSCVDGDFVLPFELSPHVTECCLGGAACRGEIVTDVHVNRIQH